MTATATPVNSIEARIREWIKDISSFEKGTRNRIAMLCYGWNWATNPARLLTDEEHKMMRDFAHNCRRELDTCPGWHESDSGRLFC